MPPFVASCPIGCGATLTETDIMLPEGALRRCSACGQLLSQASAARYWQTMAQFDDAHYNEPAGGELQRRNRVALRRLHTIARLRGKRPAECRLLDVGCSRGHFVRAALEYGFDAEGVEPARRIAAAARDAGLRIYTGLLEEQDFDDDSYDALTLFEVIEHLSEPRILLAECRRVLKPGGILVVSTGNAASWTAAIMKARWDYFQMERDGGHISFFNPVSLARLASVCGFTVARIGTARVKFHEKGQVAPGWYSAAKIAAEMLNVPARLLGRGHDMVAFLRRV